MIRVPPLAFSLGRRIGNRVRIPDGSAAVCAETALVDESRSLGNWEGRACVAGENFSVSVSQKTCLKNARTM